MKIEINIKKTFQLKRFLTSNEKFFNVFFGH